MAKGKEKKKERKERKHEAGLRFSKLKVSRTRGSRCSTRVGYSVTRLFSFTRELARAVRTLEFELDGYLFQVRFSFINGMDRRLVPWSLIVLVRSDCLFFHPGDYLLKSIWTCEKGFFVCCLDRKYFCTEWHEPLSSLRNTNFHQFAPKRCDELESLLVAHLTRETIENSLRFF